MDIHEHGKREREREKGTQENGNVAVEEVEEEGLALGRVGG